MKALRYFIVALTLLTLASVSQSQVKMTRSGFATFRAKPSLQKAKAHPPQIFTTQTNIKVDQDNTGNLTTKRQ